MSSTALCSSNGAASDAQNTVAARSYYNLSKTHTAPAGAFLRFPDVPSSSITTTTATPTAAATSCPISRGASVSSSSNNSSATALLSRPPSAPSPHVLSELAEDVVVPVPVRVTPVPRVLPALPCSRTPAKVDPVVAGAAPTATAHSSSPDSAFHPISFHNPALSPLDSEATAPKAKPLLCPPMRPSRATPVISAAVRTNPFCPDGVHVKHLPSCSPRVLSATATVAPRLHGRHTTSAAVVTVPPHASNADVAAASLWDDAASDADVLAFFGSTHENTATTATSADVSASALASSSPAPYAAISPSHAHHLSGKRANKELSWPAAETMQSSICELSFSEDMFSMGTTSSEGSAGCPGGSHRGNVIDVDAIASFQRDGARRQREVFSLASTKSATL